MNRHSRADERALAQAAEDMDRRWPHGTHQRGCLWDVGDQCNCDEHADTRPGAAEMWEVGR